MNDIEIRREVLAYLYEVHYTRRSSAPVEAQRLVKERVLPTDRLYKNLEYLAEKNLIRLNQTSLPSGTVYHFVTITATGIDLLDDPNEFNERFPSQVIHQNVAGDNIKVEIGDNAKRVVVGKGIINVEHRLPQQLNKLCTQFLDDFGMEPSDKFLAEQLTRLQEILAAPSVDLGEVQRIKKRLIEIEGTPPVKTIALFSDPSVAKSIMDACEKLIGDS
jgi:hypothetical protein